MDIALAPNKNPLPDTLIDNNSKNKNINSNKGKI
jgi:hypothetical protein